MLFWLLTILGWSNVAALEDYSTRFQAPLELVEKINLFRTDAGLPVLTVNPILEEVAQSQAEHLLAMGDLSVFDAEGFAPYQRAQRAGYKLKVGVSSSEVYSELVYHAPINSVVDPLRAWRDAPDDLAALMSPNYKELGIGIAVLGEDTYIVVDLAEPEENPLIQIAATSGTKLAPVTVSTSLPDSDIFHVVADDQGLWSIAIAYNTSVDQIKLLNNLGSDEIFIGQKLLIFRLDTPTPTPSAIKTATMGIPSLTPTPVPSQTPTATPEPLPVAPVSYQSARTWVAWIILAALVLAAMISLAARRKKVNGGS